MPTRELRPVIERIYWSAVSSLANEPHELVEEAVEHLSNTTVVCPELLARLADDLLDTETRQGAEVAGSEATSE